MSLRAWLVFMARLCFEGRGALWYSCLHGGERRIQRKWINFLFSFMGWVLTLQRNNFMFFGAMPPTPMVSELHPKRKP